MSSHLFFFFVGGGAGGPSNRFTPPRRDLMARTTPEADDLANDVFKRFKRPLVGVNVYKLKDGSYVESHPGDESLIEFTYFGASRYIVSDAEKLALQNAGYTVT